MKFYAVKEGKETGIFDNWTDCKANVDGYAGAIFKSFTNYADAEAYLAQKEEDEEINENLPAAYIDGSYLKSANLYGYGGYLQFENRIYILQGKGNEPEYIDQWNVAGEITGAIKMLYTALNLGLDEINLFYDYAGIEQWANGNWKCKTLLAQRYKFFIDGLADKIKVHFIHVKGHTGNAGNEMADLLAKDAIDAKMTKKEKETAQQFKEAAIAEYITF